MAALSSLDMTAQDVPSAMKVGDTLSEMHFRSIVNYPTSSAKLSDFKGKLVILDFWATWCTSCVNHFPALQQYQNKFGPKLQMILINSRTTGDVKKKVVTLLEKENAMVAGGFTLPASVEDSIAEKLFPHRMLPHYVWISPGGTVLAITGPEEINAKNIEMALAGHKESLALKQDIDFTRPLSADALDTNRAFYHSFFVKGLLSGLPSTRTPHISTETFGETFSNISILGLYSIVIRELYPKFSLTPKTTVLNVREPSVVAEPPELSDTAKWAWAKANACTYQLLIPALHKQRFYNWVLEDLNRVSGFRARLEKRKVTCFVLKATGSLNAIRTKGGEPESALYNDSFPVLLNSPFTHLVYYLNDVEALTFPVIDETHFNGNVDLIFRAPFNEADRIQAELRRYNLQLVKAKRTIDVMVLSETNQ